MAYNADTHKQCSKCKEVKNRDEFGSDRSKKDGIQYKCKVCARVYKKERKAYMKENNPEKYKDKKRKKRERYKLNNPEKVKEYRKRWKRNNPEKVKETKNRTRAEQKKTQLSLAFFNALKESQK
jgi:hypothetical protein